MSKRLSRRVILTSALALAACAPLSAPPVLHVETTEAARQQMLAAVRAFGAHEGLAFEDRTAAIALLPFYRYLLTGPRTTLIFSSDIHRPGVNIHFKAEFVNTAGAMPWTRGDDPASLSRKFAAALAAVPGVQVERVAPSEEPR